MSCVARVATWFRWPATLNDIDTSHTETSQATKMKDGKIFNVVVFTFSRQASARFKSTWNPMAELRVVIRPRVREHRIFLECRSSWMDVVWSGHTSAIKEYIGKGRVVWHAVTVQKKSSVLGGPRQCEGRTVGAKLWQRDKVSDFPLSVSGRQKSN